MQLTVTALHPFRSGYDCSFDSMLKGWSHLGLWFLSQENNWWKMARLSHPCRKELGKDGAAGVSR